MYVQGITVRTQKAQKYFSPSYYPRQEVLPTRCYHYFIGYRGPSSCVPTSPSYAFCFVFHLFISSPEVQRIIFLAWQIRSFFTLTPKSQFSSLLLMIMWNKTVYKVIKKSLLKIQNQFAMSNLDFPGNVHWGTTYGHVSKQRTSFKLWRFFAAIFNVW